MGSGLGGDGSGGSGSGAGAGAPLDSLNFAVIDEDLARFAQDEVVREALARGVDLRLYARQVEGELRSMEALSIRDYVGQADAVAALFEQICHCEGVLGGMQGMLGTFQGSLGGISREIRTLQEQSLSLSVSMSNRKALAGKLDTFLSKVSVPESLIARIVEGAVDDAWMTDLAALADKLQYVQKGVRGDSAAPAPAPAPAALSAGAGAGADGAAASDGSSASGPASDGGTLADLTVNPFSTPVGRESLPALERLRQAACEKLRAFLLRAVGDLAKPKTNTAKGQEFVLARFAPGMAFLNDFDPPAAREVRGRYAEAMSRVYEDIFRKYYGELRAGAQAPGALKGDTLAEYSPQARLAAAVAADSSLAPLAQALGTRLLVDPFEIGPAPAPGSGGAGAGGPGAPPGGPASRAAILPAADAPPTPSHVLVAEAAGPAGRRLPHEVIWRHVTRHLMDVACAEFAFCLRFFGASLSREMFSLVMSRPIQALLRGLEEWLMETGDAPGLLVMAALTAAHRRIMRDDRRCGELDGFFDRVAMLLWPRIKQVLDAHIASLRALKDSPLPGSAGGGAGAGGAGAGAAAGAGGGRRLVANPADLGPHPVMRRYGELACTFLLLHRQLAAAHLSDEMLPVHLAAMAKEADAVLQRAAAELPSRPAKLVFAVSNYSACLATAAARGVAPEDVASWERSAATASDAFVDAQLEAHFPSVKAFVRKGEAAAAAAAAAAGVALPPTASAPPSILSLPESLAVPLDAGEAQAVLRDFNAAWRNAARALSEDCGRLFAPPPGAPAGSGAAASASALANAMLRRTLAALVSLYDRFAALLARGLPAAGAAAVLREVVPSAVVVMELKKYAPA